ncbi:MAG: acetyl-CoA carboxylase, carboxyltransferase subunit beta [candidate division KSB1 bacterium]|nr:acetyl-CoA carboxylase, carboxyltransferase subunit beta [candidate division KSB1 bacterium]MDZ7293822.1 acetyl-CoA carboxylase, carboxyltransferase subunit beta [candidate division KSB1 bacterium]MDZ7377966.1 acetyl-CoA carboxylase, carboxyltransferase subunit beta [candidate division KSB1 bacterium]MDZ7393949.1 acetyl-CoA carboxylase, carboxyltransferase subunit beta [candidate division KSB1 bacterium]MDZ7412189.1 acetyl-CoA carboxylase, carboxyltransferase subunit beta [candidate division
MDWFKRTKRGLIPQAKRDLPNGLWVKCEQCGEILYRKELANNAHVCMKCGFHFRIGSREYVRILLDDGSAEEFNASLLSVDPLGFKDSKRYRDRIKEAMKSTGLPEAIRTFAGTISGVKVILCVMDFSFIGGSMGSVVGEKVARAADRALAERLPLIIVSSSGGARMQEAALSLMQMAKTAGRLALLDEARVPCISILTNPTTGGVTASYAMLGDLNLAEPGALIGFAGPRVIKQTIKQDLPEGFQRSEFLQQHGFIDAIVDRREMKAKLTTILEFFGYQAAKA